MEPCTNGRGGIFHTKGDFSMRRENKDYSTKGHKLASLDGDGVSKVGYTESRGAGGKEEGSTWKNECWGLLTSTHRSNKAVSFHSFFISCLKLDFL